MGQEEGCGDRSGMGNEMELDVVAKGTRYHSRGHGQGINNMTRHVIIEEQKEQQKEKKPEYLTETRKRPRDPEGNGEGPSEKRVTISL
jgi:hypothetical protein